MALAERTLALVDIPSESRNEGAVYDYVYTRCNTAGPMREHWYHASGCRNWLEVVRDTRTHEIFDVQLVQSQGEAS